VIIKRFIIAYALAMASLTMSACSPALSVASALPASPQAAADATIIDEQAMLSVELAYQASATALLVSLKSGLITGDRAAKAASLDQIAYATVLAVRAAYDAGNATSYTEAIPKAYAAIAQTLKIVKGQ
jgi:hypothetical protein